MSIPTAYQRPGRDGWFAMVTSQGRRKTLHGATRKDVERLVRDALNARDRGQLVMGPRQPFGRFLDRWMSDVVAPRVRATTLKSYASLIEHHVKPSIGRVTLEQLLPAHVEQLMRDARGAGLSPRTVQYIRGVVRSALKAALRQGLVSRNVAELVDGPMVERHEFAPFSPAQARQLLAAAQGDRLAALYTVAVSLGLRKGEAIGLRWCDVDLDGGQIHVRHQLLREPGGGVTLIPLKTSRSRRTLALPAVVAEDLRAHRQRQREDRLEIGPRWKGPEPHSPGAYVFSTTIGTPLDPRGVVRQYKALLAKAGLPDRRFHDLRHSCASLLLARGVSLRSIQEVLGHSSYTLTANTYAHVLPELQRDVAARMDDILTG
jgi:integrase